MGSVADIKIQESRKPWYMPVISHSQLNNDALIATFSGGRDPWRDWIVISH